ncbi:hypothetical protein SAMN04487947_3471 [Halogeometricum rufum]|jgi:predicted RNA-binding Zn-ribbon protein involved in translation (DUF1610 family)|uniref:Uncharacterized protein n=1 Tax=Halogeometricum rufum TaxID=553469 RepID=A0A1I6IPR5_9EURY|nr:MULTISPECIES: hypothetical protein [Halogeometricum]MUV56066.1 hypothetical protein [Halogeometricum sp. CBA1124]SFR68609.1 hypothetical protein SAMN04487947_3471 [Halogeometricum rufum]
MVQTCHVCGSTVVEDGVTVAQSDSGFVCADCGEVTCTGCQSIGLSKNTNHCRRCRG